MRKRRKLHGNLSKPWVIRLSVDGEKRLKKIARKKRRTVSGMVRAIVDQYLDVMEMGR